MAQKNHLSRFFLGHCEECLCTGNLERQLPGNGRFGNGNIETVLIQGNDHFLSSRGAGEVQNLGCAVVPVPHTCISHHIPQIVFAIGLRDKVWRLTGDRAQFIGGIAASPSRYKRGEIGGIDDQIVIVIGQHLGVENNKCIFCHSSTHIGELRQHNLYGVKAHERRVKRNHHTVFILCQFIVNIASEGGNHLNFTVVYRFRKMKYQSAVRNEGKIESGLR